MKERQVDYYNLTLWLGLIMISLVGVFLMFYYFTNVKNECLANPLIFAAEQYEHEYGFKTFGVLYFQRQDTLFLPAIYFNSTDMRLDYKN